MMGSAATCAYRRCATARWVGSEGNSRSWWRTSGRDVAFSMKFQFLGQGGPVDPREAWRLGAAHLGAFQRRTLGGIQRRALSTGPRVPRGCGSLATSMRWNTSPGSTSHSFTVLAPARTWWRERAMWALSI